MLLDLCGALKEPVEKDWLKRSLPVVGGDGASSTDMVAWLRGRSMPVREVKVGRPQELAGLLAPFEAAFVAVELPGATKLHWVAVVRVMGLRHELEVRDPRRGRVVDRFRTFLRSCRSPFWVVSRRSYA